MTTRSAAAFAISLSAMFVPIGPATAASPQLEASWRQCTDSNADISISGCTAVIQSGEETGANLATAYYNRGITHRRERHYDRAIQDYDQAIRLKPDYAEAFSNRGIAYYDKGHYDRAIEDYDQAIRLNPNIAEAFNNRSLAYYKKAQYERATQDFDQTIRLKKEYGNALINRGLGSSEAQARRRNY